jgi:hypothetical protein
MTPSNPAPVGDEREAFEAHIKTTAWYQVLSQSKDEDDDGASIFRMARMAARAAWDARGSTVQQVGADALDAARYRWLRDGENPGNRYPHLTQYPYQPDLDKFAIPQMIVNFRRSPANIDAAIDAAIASSPKSDGGKES